MYIFRLPTLQCSKSQSFSTNLGKNYNAKMKKKKRETIGEQRIFFDELMVKLNYKSLDEFLTLKKKTIIEHEGLDVYEFFGADKPKFLSTIYPNYPWPIEEQKLKFGSFGILANQQEFMDHLYYTQNFKHLNDFLNMQKSVITDNSGSSLLYYVYENDYDKLLSTVYPNYSWDFSQRIPKLNSTEYFHPIHNQHIFIENLMKKLNISLDDLHSVSKQILKDNGGRNLIEIYNSEITQLILTIYPNYPWNFRNTVEKLKTLKIRKKVLENIGKKLGIKSLDDWLSVRESKFIRLGGKDLLKYYTNNMNKLLSEIYPFHNWEFDFPKKRVNFQYISQQRMFMDNLYYRLKLRSLGDIMNLTNRQLILNGGRNLLLRYYNSSMYNLLTTVYPYYPWQRKDHQKRIEKELIEHFKNIENQKEFMNKVKIKLHLKSEKDFLRVSETKLIDNNVHILLEKYYSNNMKKLLLTLYPHHNWEFDRYLIERKNFKTIESQSQFIEYLYMKFNLKSIEDWLSIPFKRLYKFGGKMLAIYYQEDMKKLLLSIYPNYPWKFDNLKHLMIVDKHRRFMNRMYKRLGLKSLNEFTKMRKTRFEHFIGFDRMMDYYSGDMKKLLSTVYPEYKWDFDKLKFRPYREFSKSHQYLSEKLLAAMKKYRIVQKNDWYRIKMRLDEVHIHQALKVVFPEEKWSKREFILRNKKVNQRILCCVIQEIYPIYYWLENYRSPMIHGDKDRALEFDIYLPALNLAFEYQGEHHYDDIPHAFAQLELYKGRDEMKVTISKEKMNIKIILVPYWWDGLRPSLEATILQNLEFK